MEATHELEKKGTKLSVLHTMRALFIFLVMLREVKGQIPAHLPQMHCINPPPTVTAAGYSYSYSLESERNSVDEYFSSITSIECKPLYIKVNSTCETLNVFQKDIASAENAEYIDTVFSLPRKSWNFGSGASIIFWNIIIRRMVQIIAMEASYFEWGVLNSEESEAELLHSKS